MYRTVAFLKFHSGVSNRYYPDFPSSMAIFLLISLKSVLHLFYDRYFSQDLCLRLPHAFPISHYFCLDAACALLSALELWGRLLAVGTIPPLTQPGRPSLSTAFSYYFSVLLSLP